MVKVFTGTENEYYLNGFLKDNLDHAKKVIKSDWDMCILVDGMEGGGKSVLTQQIAYYCDPTLTVERICFTPEEFKNAILSTKKYQAVVYDEAYTGLSSRATMSKVNKALVSMLAEIRQKNLFVFIVMPTFFDLDKYVALWRSRALLHVYTGDKFERGRFCFYNVDRKKELYVNGKKFYSYYRPKPNFRGSFVNYYTVDKEAYRQKKYDSLKAREDDEPEVQKDKLKDAMIRMELEGLTRSKIARFMGLSQGRISQILGNKL